MGLEADPVGACLRQFYVIGDFAHLGGRARRIDFALPFGETVKTALK